MYVNENKKLCLFVNFESLWPVPLLCSSIESRTSAHLDLKTRNGRRNIEESEEAALPRHGCVMQAECALLGCRPSRARALLYARHAPPPLLAIRTPAIDTL